MEGHYKSPELVQQHASGQKHLPLKPDSATWSPEPMLEGENQLREVVLTYFVCCAQVHNNNVLELQGICSFSNELK